MKLASSELRWWILDKMVRKNLWGGKHLDYELISHGLPKDQYRDIEKELDKLVREGLVVKKPAHYGLQVSLNVRMKVEIERIIRGREEK